MTDPALQTASHLMKPTPAEPLLSWPLRPVLIQLPSALIRTDSERQSRADERKTYSAPLPKSSSVGRIADITRIPLTTKSMPERYTPPEQSGEVESQEKLELAEKFFRIAEEAARVVDELAAQALVSPIASRDLIQASQRIRHTIFSRACDVLALSDSERAQVFDNS